MKDLIAVEVKCPFCGDISRIYVVEEDYLRWQNGELIQRAMPYLPAEQREVLISGICYQCQASIFGGEDDE